MEQHNTPLTQAFGKLPEQSAPPRMHFRIMACVFLLKYRAHFISLIVLVVCNFLYFSWGVIQLALRYGRNFSATDEMIGQVQGGVRHIGYDLIIGMRVVPTGVLLRYIVSLAIVMLSISFAFRLHRAWRIFMPGLQTASTEKNDSDTLFE